MSELRLQGISLSQGLGTGPCYLVGTLKHEGRSLRRFQVDSETEVVRYKKAISASISELEGIQKQLQKERAFAGMAVIDAHLQLLHDPVLTIEIEEEIRLTQMSSLSVLQKLLSHYQKKFFSIENPFFQERFRDIQDVASRLMNHLGKKVRTNLGEIPDGAVVFATNLTPSEVASLRPGAIAGLVTHVGSLTSHTGIIARAKGIPYISQIPVQELDLQPNSFAIVDGYRGLVFLSPDEGTVKQYNRSLPKAKPKSPTQRRSPYPLKTKDGTHIHLSINLDSILDLPSSLDGITSCGLFRTEFLLNASHPPSEEEQFLIYKEVLERFENKPVVIRAFDFGGDKGTLVKEHFDEENPALGLRAIRLLLREPSLFEAQIRALLRAAPFGHLKLLLPMVTSVEEVKAIREIVDVTTKKLAEERVKTGPLQGLGCMIEVPSAALIMEPLSYLSDFFSIGTNDLVQFLLAIDRNNQHVFDPDSPFHPAVLKIIQEIVYQSAKSSKPLSICGEMAADPNTIPLLVGLGIRHFSVPSNKIEEVRNSIAKLDSEQACEKVDQSLRMHSSKEIRSIWST